MSLFSKTRPRDRWHDRNEQEGHLTMVDDQPKRRTGKLCYLEMPAADVARCAEFYRQAFGWTLRRRDGSADHE
jgi:hypothetical protein